jgi:hypothetical protein
MDTNGNSQILDEIIVEFPINELLVFQNFPNPFNNSTQIKFALPGSGQVQIELYNILGQKLELICDKWFSEGYHEVIFEAQNIPTGKYFCQIRSREWKKNMEMMIIK